jgi:nitrate reductase delta subunit
MRLTLKTLAALLTYPTAELVVAVPELRAALEAEGLLPERQRSRLDRLLDELQTRDLYDLQERYVLLFDRSRALSLHLFEHVHGESRERGQALVDLAALYARHGLEIGERELPDFLPLFLEFLSEIDETEAREHLVSPLHVLEAIRQRLMKRRSVYASVFSAIEALAKATPRVESVSELLAEPDLDPQDFEALDRAWQDEPVVFGPGAVDTSVCAPGSVMGAKMRAATRLRSPGSN